MTVLAVCGVMANPKRSSSVPRLRKAPVTSDLDQAREIREFEAWQARHPMPAR